VRLTRSLATSQIGRHFVEAWQQMEQSGAVVLAFGHSHHARTWRKASPEATAESMTGVVPIEPSYRYVLNVGTTGLPFPGKGGPSVGLCDGAHLRHLPLTWHNER
jgi:hypothetical protein